MAALPDAPLRHWAPHVLVARAYAYHELPGFGHLLHRVGMNDQPRWSGAPIVECRGRMHKYWMRLELADFFQRIAYFFGGYHELDVISAIDAVARPGEHFADAGANIGLVTLHAARRVFGWWKDSGRGWTG